MKLSKRVSSQPRKIRRALYNAPLHQRRHAVAVHFSRELRSQLRRRSAGVAKGDTVKVIHGKFKGASGKVVEVDLKAGFISVEKLMLKKQSGREVPARIRPNKLLLMEISSSRKVKAGGKATAAPGQAPKAAPGAVSKA